jgi:hypothetical protein
MPGGLLVEEISLGKCLAMFTYESLEFAYENSASANLRL